MTKPKPKPDAVDWDAVRAAYLTEYADQGGVDLQRMAANWKPMLNYGTLRNRVSAGKWAQEGEALRTEVLSKTAEAAVPIIVRHRVDVIERHLTFLGQVRQIALNQIGKVAQEGKLPLKDAMKLVFDSLRAEKMLQDMVGDGPTGNMNDEDVQAAMFNRFMEKLAQAEVVENVTAKTQALTSAPPTVQ